MRLRTHPGPRLLPWVSLEPDSSHAALPPAVVRLPPAVRLSRRARHAATTWLDLGVALRSARRLLDLLGGVFAAYLDVSGCDICRVGDVSDLL